MRAAPVISMALFLKVLMTVPSLRLRRGLLRRSATFCFNRERTFRLGSEAGGGVQRKGPSASPLLLIIRESDWSGLKQFLAGALIWRFCHQDYQVPVM